MPHDPNATPSNENSQAGSAPQPFPAPEPPTIGAPPPLTAAVPPSLAPRRTPNSLRQPITVILSLCLGLFLGDAVISLADDSLTLLGGVHPLAVLRGIVFLLAIIMALVTYALMGLTPMIPKRLFLPVTLFSPLAGLVTIAAAIYYYDRLQTISWLISICQVVFALGLLRWIQGGFRFRWPLVPASRLADRRFSWHNLAVFLIVNVFGVLPAVLAYLVLCAALAVNHFTEGFLVLRSGGLAVQVRDYVRTDGKTIRLVPMSHVGNASFYRTLWQSFSTNSTILLEGVSDRRNLLTNKISYKRLANSLGLAEQQKEFRPTQGKLVPADVDVEQFATNTIVLLNLVMLIHAKGLNLETVMQLLQFSPSPHAEGQLWEDLLTKRNEHLLEEIYAWLAESETIVVPWGVAHMPGIARGIQQSGFRLGKTREQMVIRFGSSGSKGSGAKQGERPRAPD